MVTFTMPLVALALLVSVAHSSVRQQKKQQQTPLRLARLFGSNMVLQQGTPAAIWGWAAPGILVTAELVAKNQTAQRVNCTAANDGAFTTTFAAMPASTTPFIIRATVKGSAGITLRNLVFGDVLLCAGQSNVSLGMAPSPMPLNITAPYC